MYTTVIFDLDGTLLNTLDDLADAGNRICAENGWPLHTAEEYKHFVGNGIPKLVERFSPPAARTPQALAGALARYEATYSAHMFDKTRPYEGLPALLGELSSRGVQLAVFSNKDDALAKSVVARYYPHVPFAAVRGALPGVEKKPAPQGTKALLGALNARLEKTLYVGDSNVDVQTAQNAGLRFCGVLWGFRSGKELRAAGADLLAADAAALREAILAGPGGNEAK